MLRGSTCGSIRIAGGASRSIQEKARPSTLGAALKEIAQDPVVSNALSEVLKTQKITQGDAQLILVPAGSVLWRICWRRVNADRYSVNKAR